MRNHQLATGPEAQRALKLSKSTLAKLRTEGLPVIKVSPRAYRYDLDAVRAWLDARVADVAYDGVAIGELPPNTEIVPVGISGEPAEWLYYISLESATAAALSHVGEDNWRYVQSSDDSGSGSNAMSPRRIPTFGLRCTRPLRIMRARC
jgi:hypothetical protein